MMKTFFRRIAPLIIIAVAVLGAELLMMTKQEPEQKAEEIPLPVVDVTQVEQQTMSLNLPSYGTVTPKNKTQLVSEVQGRILSIAPAFVAGGVVHQGDELAVIEPSDYEADLMQAQATLAQAKAALDEEIARGEVAKIEFSGYDNGMPPELGLRVPQLKKEQANVKYAEAALARAKRNLERTVIRAPFDAIVRARSVDLGQYVAIGSNLGELYDTAVAEVRLPLANKDLAYLESVDNPDTQVTLSAALAGKTVTWTGKVVRSEGVIDPDNRMVYLVAEVQDPYLRKQKQAGQLPLKYGSFVNAVIKGRTVDGLVKLPRHMVRNQHVAVVNKDNKIEMRQVNVVRTDLEYVYIKDSLKDGERISKTNLNNMTNGQLVRVANDKDKDASHSEERDTQEQHLAAAGEL
ncbi:efflux RND transporter periplasmic adaptor subunit [Shewanella chilikensis]|uniref:efflux RND transporter periplasmic adaptor subunit n=1 Tax=Shewanella chilikensis TaxID=558541 RepID=UPI001F3E8B7D|nr:efflux RND transporter periplasmic adaptor subunit [Shewanella chilikensis]MCE9789540.1 efflux RND transporter periplasmic adaptor subunit [Shewanella chilikensis]